jgi:two-component system sensor histidine kinase VanS
MSVRLKLTLSYAGVIVASGGLLLATVWVFLLRYVPTRSGPGPASPTRTDLVNAFLPRAGQAMAFLLVLGLVGGWFLAGRMLAPLRRITEATRLVSTGSLSHRIRLEGRGDEFRELADAFDTMLDRVEARVAEQQRFAANASHEQRTPLAVTQTLLDVAREDDAVDHRELVDRLHSVNARAIELTEALLLLSRADQRSFVSEEVDLSLLAEEAAETLLPLAEARGVTVETAGVAAAAVGSPALLQQMTTNLLHNAIVHNLPHAGTVRISTSGGTGGSVLTVENTGPRLGQPLVATLVEPFQRGSQRARSDHGGVGLGLAIVDSIVRAHDGTLTLTARPEGGLLVAVHLNACDECGCAARHWGARWVLGHRREAAACGGPEVQPGRRQGGRHPAPPTVGRRRAPRSPQRRDLHDAGRDRGVDLRPALHRAAVGPRHRLGAQPARRWWRDGALEGPLAHGERADHRRQGRGAGARRGGGEDAPVAQRTRALPPTTHLGVKSASSLALGALSPPPAG